MATRTTPQTRRLSMLSAPTRQAVEFSDAVTAAGGVMPTGGAFSTANNPWLKKYGATLTDFDDRVAFTAAQGIADKNNQKAGGPRLTGGYGWAQFDDFHNVRSQEERLKGNRYGVGAISGGGDINQRPLDGSGPTFQVNAPRAATAARSQSGFSAMPQAARPTAASTAPAWLETLRADAEAAELRRSIEQNSRRTGGFMIDDPLRGQRWVSNADAEADSQHSQALNRGMAERRALEALEQFTMPQRAALTREDASRDSWRQSKDKSGQYWAHEEPIEQNRHAQKTDLAEINALPAKIAAESRLGVADMTQDGQNYRQQLQVLSDLVASLQRGESGAHGFNDPRAAQLGGAFDAARGLAEGQALQGPGGATPPRPAAPAMPAAAAPGSTISEPGAPDFGPEVYGPVVRDANDGTIWTHRAGRWTRGEQ